MSDHLGKDMRKVKNDDPEKKKKKDDITTLDEDDIALMQIYGTGPYYREIKQKEQEIQATLKRIKDLSGWKASDSGLAAPALWNLVADQLAMVHPHYWVGRCIRIIRATPEEARQGLPDKYIINVRHFVNYETRLHKDLDPTDIKEGMRIAVNRKTVQIVWPLPPKMDRSVSTMTVEAEERPDVTYSDVGGCKEQIDRVREVIEAPLLNPERFTALGIDPPKGVLLYGPPGTGKTLCARAVANRTEAFFFRVIGSELVKKYAGEGARTVRELFALARTKKAAIIFFDEVDSFGGTRFQSGGESNEVQRTMLELINQLDGFDRRGNIKVIMATNRPDTLDPALTRPGRLDRKVEFGMPDLAGRAHIFKIHARAMSVEKGQVRFDLLARLCPNSTGAEIRSVCTEAGMFAIRARRRVCTERDFLEAVQKVIKSYAKFSSTARYMAYN